MGIKIIHRLDGWNWQHKIEKKSFIYYIKSEIRQYIVTLIRFIFADHLIYMSKFVRDWWEDSSKINKTHSLIYNGSPINKSKSKKFNTAPRFIAVEGSVNGSVAYEILRKFNFDIDVYGEYDVIKASNMPKNIVFKGVVKRQTIQSVLEDYTGFLCLESLPACPNSVIESLSFGVPVIGLDNGALMELVNDAGVIIQDKGNPWKLEVHQPENLNAAAEELIKNQTLYSQKAYLQHQKNFNIDDIVEQYLDVILKK